MDGMRGIHMILLNFIIPYVTGFKRMFQKYYFNDLIFTSLYLRLTVDLVLCSLIIYISIDSKG